MRRKPNLDTRTERCSFLLASDPGALRGRWLDAIRPGTTSPEARRPDLLGADAGHPDEVHPDGLYSGLYSGLQSGGLYSGNLHTDMSHYDGLHVELGCGKGLFTIGSAKAEPGRLFVAIEKISNVLVIALERAAAEDLQNVLFINALVDDVAEFFAGGEVSRLYINFCDPWPANRHIKRRLTGRRFLEMYRLLLCPGGEIHFKTDNLPLFEFSLHEFDVCGFELLETERDLHRDGPVGVMTDYESKFFSMGLPIYRCVARLG